VTELLVGTKKGLFVLRGDPSAGQPFDIAHRAFPGDVVEFAMRDPRSGRYFASVTSGFYGPRVLYADDPTGEWEQARGPAFPEGTDTAVERIWRIEPGEADGLLYAGAAPASLFTSTDGGETWTLNEPLWQERIAGDWQPGAGGLALHSICPWPGEPDRIAVGISAMPVYIRVVRGSVLSVREREYVEAARVIGGRDLRIVLGHVLPNVLAPVIVLATLGVPQAIIAGASLSFLGLGVKPPTPDWGSMLSNGRDFLGTAWWLPTFPGLAIVITVIAVNLLGDGLRDALDPRLKV